MLSAMSIDAEVKALAARIVAARQWYLTHRATWLPARLEDAPWVDPTFYREVGAFAESMGLEWLADWRPVYEPHHVNLRDSITRLFTGSARGVVLAASYRVSVGERRQREFDAEQMQRPRSVDLLTEFDDGDLVVTNNGRQEDPKVESRVRGLTWQELVPTAPLAGLWAAHVGAVELARRGRNVMTIADARAAHDQESRLTERCRAHLRSVGGIDVDFELAPYRKIIFRSALEKLKAEVTRLKRETWGDMTQNA
jgi:hypothetical protein